MGLKHGGRKARAGRPKRPPKVKGARYNALVLLHACPTCQRGVGQTCVSVSRAMFGEHYGKELKGPHPERVQLAKGPS